MTQADSLGEMNQILLAMHELCLSAPAAHPPSPQLLRREMARRIEPIAQQLETDLRTCSPEVLREHAPQLFALQPPVLRAALGLMRSPKHGPAPKDAGRLPALDNALQRCRLTTFARVQEQAQEAQDWLACHQFERAAEGYQHVFSSKPYLKKDSTAPAYPERKAFFAEHWPQAFMSFAEAAADAPKYVPSAIEAGLHVMAPHRPRPTDEVLASALSLIETLLQPPAPESDSAGSHLCGALALWQRFGTWAAAAQGVTQDPALTLHAKKIYGRLQAQHGGLSLPRQRGHALEAFGFDAQDRALGAITADPRYPLDDFKPLPAAIERLFDDLVAAAHGAHIKSRNWVLTGDPGEGKTSLIRSLLAEADRRVHARQDAAPWPLRVVHASQQQFLGQFHNESREKISRFFTDVMQEAQKSHVIPIVVIEEADAILGAGTSGGLNQDDNRATVATLEFLDNSHPDNRLVVLCTTNRIDMFTPAARSRFGANVLHYQGSIATKRKLVASLLPHEMALPAQKSEVYQGPYPDRAYLMRMLTAAAVPYAARAVEAAVAAAGTPPTQVRLFEDFLASLTLQPSLPAFSALPEPPVVREIHEPKALGIAVSFSSAYRNALAQWVQARARPYQTFLPLVNRRVGDYRFVAAFDARGLSQWVLVAGDDAMPSHARGEVWLAENGAERRANSHGSHRGPQPHVQQKRFEAAPMHQMVRLCVDLTKLPPTANDAGATITWRCTLPGSTAPSAGWAPLPHFAD